LNLNREVDNLSEGIKQQREEIMSAIQLLASSIETLKTNLKVQEGASGIQKSIQLLSEGFSASAPRIQSISSKLNEIESSSDSLIKEIKEVSDMSGNIKEISEQTLLLSMNALIESSKAGEYGKGFAVIADEIRQLSVSISSLSDNISSKTSSMRGNVNKILIPTKDSKEEIKYLSSNLASSVKELEGLEEISRGLLESTSSLMSLIVPLEKVKEEIVNSTNVLSMSEQEFENIKKEIKQRIISTLRVVVGQAEKIFKRFNVSWLSKQIFDVKVGHILFMLKIEDYMEGKVVLSEREKEEVSDYTICSLGKWYYSSKEKYSNIPAFTKLEKVHKEFHENSKRVLEFFDKGDKGKAMELLGKIEYSFLDIISLLDEIEKELSTHENAE